MTAPIDGRVSRALVTAGNFVDASIVLTTVVSGGPSTRISTSTSKPS